MLLVNNISIEEVVGYWTLKSKDFESSVLRIHYSVVSRRKFCVTENLNFFVKTTRADTRGDFYERFFLPIDRKLLKNRENTAMNKKVRLLLGTDFQEFTAQVSRHKNNLWFSLQSIRIRRFWCQSEMKMSDIHDSR